MPYRCPLTPAVFVMALQDNQPTAAPMSDEERGELLRHLKIKWASVNVEYQKLGFVMDIGRHLLLLVVSRTIEQLFFLNRAVVRLVVVRCLPSARFIPAADRRPRMAPPTGND
jgi:hypothetical protein